MRIFLSYASQDREAARAIELGLREQGHDVFFDPGYRLSPVKRWNADPGQRSEDLGFRCARDAE